MGTYVFDYVSPRAVFAVSAVLLALAVVGSVGIVRHKPARSSAVTRLIGGDHSGYGNDRFRIGSFDLTERTITQGGDGSIAHEPWQAPALLRDARDQ